MALEPHPFLLCVISSLPLCMTFALSLAMTLLCSGSEDSGSSPALHADGRGERQAVGLTALQGALQLYLRIGV